LTDAGAERGRLLPKGSVLVTCIGNLGKVSIANRDLCTNQQINSLIPSSQIDSSYLYHACNRLKPQLAQAASSTTVPIVKKSSFQQLTIPLPALEEQRRIAAILDKADELRTKRREAIAKLDTLAQSIFIDMFGDPRGNPLSLPESTVAEIAERVTDGEHATPPRTTSGVKLLSARNVRQGHVDFANIDYVSAETYARLSKRIKPQKGDVLISCSGSIGRVTSVDFDEPFSLVRSVALIRTHSDLVHHRYLEHYLQTPWMQQEMSMSARSSSQANLFQGPIKKLRILLPDIGSQLDFAKKAEQVMANRADLVRLERKTYILFSALQQRAFKGEL